MNAQIAQPPSAVFVDAGGVLVLPCLRDVAKAFGSPDIPDEELRSAFYRAFSQPDHERDETEWLWEAFASELGIEPSRVADALESLASRQLDPWRDGPEVGPHATDLLQLLSRAGIPTVVVSNSNGTVARLLETVGACQVGDGELPPVAGIVDSHIVGIRKPDSRIFRYAREAVENATGQPLNLADTVHIGDALWSDVAAADHAGIPVIHLDPTSHCPERDHHAHAQSLKDVPALIGLDY